MHAHKIDTRCGDGIWVGTFIGERNKPPRKLGEFIVSAHDNVGKTRSYFARLSLNTYVLTIIDIRGTANCDQTRVYIDIYSR